MPWQSSVQGEGIDLATSTRLGARARARARAQGRLSLSPHTCYQIVELSYVYVYYAYLARPRIPEYRRFAAPSCVESTQTKPLNARKLTDYDSAARAGTRGKRLLAAHMYVACIPCISPPSCNPTSKPIFPSLPHAYLSLSLARSLASTFDRLISGRPVRSNSRSSGEINYDPRRPRRPIVARLLGILAGPSAECNLLPPLHPPESVYQRDRERGIARYPN